MLSSRTSERVLLNLKTTQSFEDVVGDLGQVLKMTGANRLYTRRGKEIKSFSHLKMDFQVCQGIDRQVLFSIITLLFVSNVHMLNIFEVFDILKKIKKNEADTWKCILNLSFFTRTRTFSSCPAAPPASAVTAQRTMKTTTVMTGEEGISPGVQVQGIGEIFKYVSSDMKSKA